MTQIIISKVNIVPCLILHSPKHTQKLLLCGTMTSSVFTQLTLPASSPDCTTDHANQPQMSPLQTCFESIVQLLSGSASLFAFMRKQFFNPRSRLGSHQRASKARITSNSTHAAVETVRDQIRTNDLLFAMLVFRLK